MYLINREMCVLLYIGVVVDIPDILGEMCTIVHFVVVDVPYILGEMSTIVHRCCCGCK